MQLEPMRFVSLVLAACLAAGCASDGANRPPGEQNVAGSQAAMSNKGLANLSLAQNYLAAGRLEFAMDRANRALRSDPNSADVQIVMGMIRERLGDTQRAGEHFAYAARLGPESGHVLNVYGVWLCEQGSTAEADALFIRAGKDVFYKSKEQALFNAGKCAIKAGQLDKAEDYLRRGLALAPENGPLLSEMARLQYLRGDYMSARAFVQRREALGGVNAELLYLAGNIEQAAGDAAGAARYRQRLESQFPDFTPTATEASRQP
jgi:type IV pilus assembly protein PilF